MSNIMYGIIVMAIVTAMIRLLPVVLYQHEGFSKLKILQKFLYYFPQVVLMTLVLSSVLVIDNSNIYLGDNPSFLTLVLILSLLKFTDNILIILFSGVSLHYLLALYLF